MFKLFQKSLLNQLVGSFSALFLLTLSIVSLTAYARARQSLEDSIFQRLNVAVSLKEYELKEWFREQRNDVLLLAKSPVVQLNIKALSQRPKTEKERSQQAKSYQEVQNYFKNVLRFKKHLQDISLVSSSGFVILSTDKSLEGKYQGSGNLTTYFKPNDRQITPNFYKSALKDKPAITLGTPITDDRSKRLGDINVNLDLEVVDEFIREKTGLGETGKTYLVGKLAGRNVLISGDSDNLTLEDEVSSTGIDIAMSGRQGQGLYFNYQKVPVIGVYRWIETEGFALIAEMDRTEAFQPAALLCRETIAIGLISSSILLLAVYALARHLSNPIIVLTDSAGDIEAGHFESDRLDPVKQRHDELGHLARVFQQMANEVQKREERLKQQVAELKIEIDQTKRIQQVSEVTDTEYFRDLQQRSRELRNRRRQSMTKPPVTEE